jgi:potassium-transporting ATPase KdpC subunit
LTTKPPGSYRPAIALAVISLLLCGILFPLVVTGIAQIAFPYQANGSQVRLGNQTVGSYYIDNGFTRPVFFHGRNETNPQNASASGVDPDIALSDALSQIPGVHNATGISVSALTNLVDSHVQRTLWVAGDPYVNVLELNLALISAYPAIYSAYQ